jgi:hypothetical protein
MYISIKVEIIKKFAGMLRLVSDVFPMVMLHS